MKKLLFLSLLMFPVVSTVYTKNKMQEAIENFHVCEKQEGLKPCQRIFNFLISQIEQSKTEKEIEYFEKVARKHAKTMPWCLKKAPCKQISKKLKPFFICVVADDSHIIVLELNKRIDNAVQKAKESMATNS